jgi:hypothetical protein
MGKEEKFKRVISTIKPFDKRKDPKGNYGIGPLIIKFSLIGKKGTAEFLLNTNAFMCSLVSELTIKTQPLNRYTSLGSLAGWGVCIHSKRPLFKNQTPSDCGVLVCIAPKGFGGVCYYADTYLTVPDECLDAYLNKGDEGVWACLQDYYYSVYEERSKWKGVKR